MDAALGRPRLIGQPSSRPGGKSPYGMIGGIEETSASFEARSAPRSYPANRALLAAPPVEVANREVKHMRRDLIACSMVALAAATSGAVGQKALSGATRVDAKAAAAAHVPDFSGIWAHPYFPGFEPPASGPGPITNRSRRARDGVGNANQFVGDYTNPILKPYAAEAVRRHGEISLRGATYPTPSNQCWPSGVPLYLLPARAAGATAARAGDLPLPAQSRIS